MKTYLAAAVLALGIASGAQAVTYTTAPGAPDPGPGAGNFIVVNFEVPLPAGYSLSGDFAITSGTSVAAAAPALDATRYLYASSALGSGIATLSTPALQTISFYWGSIDDYNKVEVLGPGSVVLATVHGMDISPATGDQSLPATNERIFFTAGPGQSITGLRFTTTGVAFEIDDISTAVPEPATWAMMILGFGMVGFAVRRRERAALSAA